MLNKRVETKVLEKILITLMICIGLAITYLFFVTRQLESPEPLLLVIILLLLTIVSILGLTTVCVKIYEQLLVRTTTNETEKAGSAK